MALIEWSENLSVGIPQIDEQHRQLISILNRLYERVGAGMSAEDLGGFIDELAAYGASHFIVEERYLREYNFANAEEHEQKHQEFVNYVASCREKVDAGDLANVTDLVYFLAFWVYRHIEQEDRQLARIASAVRASSAPIEA